jgi:hypothetical protein
MVARPWLVPTLDGEVSHNIICSIVFFDIIRQRVYIRNIRYAV